MKKLLILVLSFVLILSFVSCGYNKVMVEHLSDSNNYKQYNATVVKIYYEDEDNTLHEDYQSESIANAARVLIEVSLGSKKEIAPFYGVSEESLDKECSEYTVKLEVIPENNKLLFENGFYNAVKEGTNIMVKASDWIYMDGDFFHVSSVTCDGIEYLNESVGLQNIVDMMDN